MGMAISVRENQENRLESGHLKDAFWLVSEALYEVSKVLGLPAEMLAETLGLDGVRSKYSEIRLTKEEQKLDVNSRATGSVARDDRETRDRKDRDHQNLTLTVLLASASYRAAWEKAMDGLPELGAAMDDFQDKIDALLADEKALLKADLERVGARLPDGRYVFKGADGSIVYENLEPLKGEDIEAAEKVDFTGTMTLEDYRARKGKIDRLETMSDEHRRDRAEIADIHAKLTDPNNPAQSEDEVKGLDAKKDAGADRFEERVQELDALTNLGAENANKLAEANPSVVAGAEGMAVLKLP